MFLALGLTLLPATDLVSQETSVTTSFGYLNMSRLDSRGAAIQRGSSHDFSIPRFVQISIARDISERTYARANYSFAQGRLGSTFSTLDASESESESPLEDAALASANVNVQIVSIEAGLRLVDFDRLDASLFGGIGLIHLNPDRNEPVPHNRNLIPIKEFESTLKPQVTLGFDLARRISERFSITGHLADRIQICSGEPKAGIQYTCEVEDRLVHHLEIAAGVRYTF